MSSTLTNPQAAIVPSGQDPLLEVRDLKVYFPFHRGHMWHKERGFVRAVDGVSFTVRAGETLGLVGESGCGKSTTARAILNLLHSSGAAVQVSGQVLWQGQRIDELGDARMRPFRRQMQMIFQDPFASLNPRMTVGAIVAEPMHIFRLHPPKRRKLEVLRLLDMVGLNPRYLNRYPHEFSGGQRQRIGIARALAVNPKLIICDEPVSALDVSIQAQVINLLTDLQRQLGLAYVFIAHNLSVVRHISDRIGVMYLGRIVELTDAATLYRQPLHPYTKALLSAVPIPDPAVERERRRTVLAGDVPSPDRVYPGCRFVDRCPIAEPPCQTIDPPLAGAEHKVACLVANRERGQA
ncbi:MAG TPA: oligopeptide/dipeptide ABC transporter ATP-binding protein [Pirellulales bacterium]|jgi:oligopeptide transport system ATP-binding protein|nr:oligopeptide/dipeptide ABC transporter ATP-binding protein [Pirellulales bacterium]